MGTDRPRYTVSVDDELFKMIEDFRFENRYATRSDATVELIRLGLEAIKQMDDAKKLEALTERVDEDIRRATELQQDA